jgi:GT2 family glycosyltransferase
MATAERTVTSESKEIVCSVCIANYNGRDIIDDCLRSVLEQKCGFSYEVIVHDDASTDGYTDTIATNYPQITLIRSEQNVGYCISNNRMAERARGRYLLLLNNDATLLPDALQSLHAVAIRETVPVILTLPQYNAETGALVDRGLRLDPFLNPVPNLDPTRSEVSTVHGACLWVPKDLWNKLGGFPEWFHTLAEDLYLCCTARLQGAKVLVPPNSGYKHRIGFSLGGGKAQDTGLDTTFNRRTLSERNKNFVMILCYPWPALLVILPLHITLLLTEGMVLALIKRNPQILFRIYFNALTSLWQYRSILCGQRRILQQSRTTGVISFFSTFTFLPHKLRLLVKYGIPRIRS